MNPFITIQSALWIGAVVIVLASYWKAHQMGQEGARIDYERQAAMQVAKYRELEQRLIVEKHILEVRHAESKKANETAIANARGELGRLRNTLAQRQASADTASTSGVCPPCIERELFGESTEALVQLASEADGLRIRLRGLQEYTNNVCRPSQE